MKRWALTGGIATGKSTAGAIMRRLVPSMFFFDCDLEVGKLLERDEVLKELSDEFGPSIFAEDGTLVRSELRALVFDSPPKRKRLEAILHPKVREECLEKCQESSRNTATMLFVADVPLLFENGFDFGQELNLVVATSEATQRKRLKARSHFDDRMISSILKAQLPIMEKVVRGDVVFWNEGDPAILEKQLARFLESFQFS
jgi:dephospho-CoA kinase